MVATIKKHGDGWQAIVRKKYKKPVYKTFPKKKMAEDWARKIEEDMARGAYIDSRAASKVLIGALLERYEQEITPTKAETSRKREKGQLLGVLMEEFGSTIYAELHHDQVVSFVRKRLAAGMSADTVRKDLQLLGDVFAVAEAVWDIQAPQDAVGRAKRIIRKLRLLPAGNERERRLSDGEEEKLMAVEVRKKNRIKYALRVLLGTAMRRSELLRARRSDVDWKNCTLTIYQSKTDWKTGKKGRVIPLFPEVMDTLRELPAKIVVDPKTGERKVEELFFPIRPRGLTRAFERLCADAGISDLRLHDIRHEATSRLFERGLSIQEVASITGHRDWRSLKRYTHIKPKHLLEKQQARSDG